MTLRPYQTDCLKKMVWARTLDGNDLIQLPTGSGKSLVISAFAQEIQEPVLILVPSKELLEQDKEKLEPWTKVNVYSAGMNEKTVGNITLATIQSAYKNPELFTQFKVVIIDEADLINPKDLTGMYQKLFRGMGDPKIYGLTATPFRNDSYYRSWGKNFWQKESVHTVKILTRYRERFWTRMLYVYHTEDLINEGYLVPLNYHRINLVTHDKLSFNKSKSEFDLVDFQQEFNPFLDEVATTCVTITQLDEQVLAFVATITQGENLKRLIPDSELITGQTPKKKREKIVEGFRDGTLKCVINVGVLLIGFDKPDLKHIVVARPTRSLRLHLQMLGRGMRISPQKSVCEVYDFVGNTDFLGEAESLRIEKNPEKNLWDIKTSKGYWHYKEIFTYKLPSAKTQFAVETPQYLRVDD